MKPRIDYDVDEHYLPALMLFPFEKNLEEWHAAGVTPHVMRRGNSRHQVLFVKSKLASHPYKFAIKETTLEFARREIENYHKLRDLDIQTLTPVGIVVRHEEDIAIETPAGIMYQ